MGKLTRYIAQLTLGRLMLMLSAFALVVSFVLIFLISEVVRDQAVHELARDDAKQTSKLVFQSLYSAMRKGWSKQEINETIERLNAALPETKIRVYRGDIVTQQFGEMSGDERASVQNDVALSQAMSTGQDMLLFPDQKAIRYLYPVLATEECLVCHTQSRVGAVHGVIDIIFPISNLKVSFQSVTNSIIGYTLLVISAVLIILYIKLRYLVVIPIAKLVTVMRGMTSDMDLSRRVKSSNLLVELNDLSKYFNQLLSTVQEYNTRLEELSVRDPLTGLYNRRKFQEFLQHEIVRANRYQKGFSLIMIDLDNFKYINDTYGHPVGDLVLKELSAMLSTRLRKGDVLARLGGDEFAVIMPETVAANGLMVANKLRKELEDREFELMVGKIQTTASFSMVSFPEDGKTEQEIYSAMDVVLYKAKTHGKNRVMTAEIEEDRSMMSVFKQGEMVRTAMREGRIEAFLQPIVDVRTRKVMAYEVLMRMRDGDKIIPADEFVEVAEQLGMAQELDQEIFRKGLAHYAQMSANNSQVKFFFNLFPRSFGNLDWMRSIPELVRSAGVSCENVVLEITEREALPNLTEVRAVIEELRDSRICIALDDFGSGFSSFLYLKYLAIDYVKIEGSFVRQIAVDPRDRIIVEQINDMAHQFGLKTVAEFVEDEATAVMLAEIGVDLAQGYHYGRPALPAMP